MQSILWRPTNILLHAKIILLRMQNILWRATNILQRPTNILLRMQSILRRAKSIRCRMHGSLSLKTVDLGLGKSYYYNELGKLALPPSMTKQLINPIHLINKPKPLAPSYFPTQPRFGFIER